MDAYDSLQDWIAAQKAAGVDINDIMSALEMALDAMREEEG